MGPVKRVDVVNHSTKDYGYNSTVNTSNPIRKKKSGRSKVTSAPGKISMLSVR